MFESDDSYDKIFTWARRMDRTYEAEFWIMH
jgi:hypothetical protein